MHGYDEQKEIREALAAGEIALEALESADLSLRSARSTGVMDILGDDAIAGMVKQSRAAEAKRYVEKAEEALSHFRSELTDVRSLSLLSTHQGEFALIVNLAAEGPIADVYMQGRIEEACRNIAKVSEEVKKMLMRLSDMQKS